MECISKKPIKIRFVTRIKMIFWRLKEKRANKYEKWLDKEIGIALKNELSDKEDIMNNYVESIYKNAKSLAIMFSKQGHSGMSAGLTINLFNKMANHKALSPLNLDDSEFHKCTTDELEQNIRDSSVFRWLDKGEWKYSQNHIIEVVNDDEVWEKYPPVGDNGTLDDNDPLVKNYFDKVSDIRNKRNSEIKAPYSLRKYKYKWNFDTCELEEIK